MLKKSQIDLVDRYFCVYNGSFIKCRQSQVMAALRPVSVEVARPRLVYLLPGPRVQKCLKLKMESRSLWLCWEKETNCYTEKVIPV